MAFAELLSKGRDQEYLVLMAGQLDDKIAAELESKGVADAKVIARHGLRGRYAQVLSHAGPARL